jgi:hypothetical protein
LTTLNNAVLASQGGVVGYEAALINVERAQQKLTETQNDGEATALDLREATNQLEQAKIQAASAAYGLQASEGSLANLLKTQGVGSLVALRDSLQQTILKHGDASGATQAQIDKINTMIERANAVPPGKTLKYDADTKAAHDKTEDLNRHANDAARPRTLHYNVERSGWSGIEGFQYGGIVPGPRGVPQLVIAHGGERITPPGSSSGRSFARGGPSTIIVNITPTGLGADAPEIQRQVVAAIRGYVDRNGVLRNVAG